jgi:hypothetical protein
MAGQQEDNGAWLRAASAAALLQISEKTVRRRARAGRKRARQVSTGHGPAWEVWVGGAEPSLVTDRARVRLLPTTDRSVPDSQEDLAGKVAGQTEALLEALRLIHTLSEENRNLAGQLGSAQSQLQQRDEQIKALQAPAGDPESAHAPEGAPEGQQMASTNGAGADTLCGLSRPRGKPGGGSGESPVWGVPGRWAAARLRARAAWSPAQIGECQARPSPTVWCVGAGPSGRAAVGSSAGGARAGDGCEGAAH